MRYRYRSNKRKKIVGVLLGFILVGTFAYSQISGDKQEDAPPPLAPSTENKEDLTSEAINDSKQVAEEFVKNFASLDINKPIGYLEKSRGYMSDGLYKIFSEQPKRPLANEVKREVVSMKTYPVDSISPGQKKWNVIATVETTNRDNSKQKEEFWYWLMLKKKDSSWQVQGVDVDVGPDE